jgi:pyruvate/2-oxoglutarate dehydrogenase complex dihydrolipoamide acyltransferase (E2) component
MTEIIVPKWGLTMDEAVLTVWLKQPGDSVAQDESVAEVETDKATGEIVSPVAGVLLDVLVDAGAQVEPGQVIGRIAEPGDND